jgi:hypothetical protein
MLDGKHYIDVDMVAEVLSGVPQVLEPHKVESWEWYAESELPAPLFVVTKT